MTSYDDEDEDDDDDDEEALLYVMKVRKVVSLQVWNGSNYLEIASAQAGITLQDNFRDLKSIILQLPNSGVSFTMNAENDITNLGNDEFCNTFGIKTTNSEIEALVNEEYPKTSQFTNASAAKELTSSNLFLIFTILLIFS